MTPKLLARSLALLALSSLTLSGCSFVPSTRDHALVHAREHAAALNSRLEYFAKTHDDAESALADLLAGTSRIGVVVISVDETELRPPPARNGVWIYDAKPTDRDTLKLRILLRDSAETSDWTGTENHNVYLCAAITQSFTEPKTTSVEQVECPQGLVDGTSDRQKEDEATLDEIGLDGNE